MTTIDTNYTTLTGAVEITEDNAREISLSAGNTASHVGKAARSLLRLMAMSDEGGPTAEVLAEAAWGVDCLLDLEAALNELAQRAEKQDHGERLQVFDHAAARVARESLAGQHAEPRA
ncbi:MAG: hypothetical protein LPK43_03800 [Gammaproteobacteria bacterium]|nr:hypothetical protein [Gammaproteobacteria bacterium]